MDDIFETRVMGGDLVMQVVSLSTEIERLRVELAESILVIKNQREELTSEERRIDAQDAALKVAREALTLIRDRTYVDAEGPQLRAQNESTHRDSSRALITIDALTPAVPVEHGERMDYLLEDGLDDVLEQPHLHTWVPRPEGGTWCQECHLPKATEIDERRVR